MPILYFSCFLFFLLLQACSLDEGIRVQVNPESLTPRPSPYTKSSADSQRFHRVEDDRIAGQVKRPLSTVKDAATGTTYQVNPNWRILQRQPRVAGQVEANALTQTWTDSSGQVETRIYECASTTPSSFQNSIGCQVEPDFILVGGGAWANYGNGAGALLWESRPLDPNLSTWVASSKAQVVNCNHTLHTYAIGMRLKGNNGSYIPRTDLLNQHIYLTSLTTSPPVRRPRFESDLVSLNGEVLAPAFFGGGARANWSGPGALLTEVGTGQGSKYLYGHWRAASKDHYRAEATTLSVYAIFAKNILLTSGWGTPPIPNFGRLKTEPFSWSGNTVSTGPAVAIADVMPGRVMVGMGGEAETFSGEGRLLTAVRPTGTWSGQVSVYSKDHYYKASGRSRAWLMMARKLPE